MVQDTVTPDLCVISTYHSPAIPPGTHLETLLVKAKCRIANLEDFGAYGDVPADGLPAGELYLLEMIGGVDTFPDDIRKALAALHLRPAHLASILRLLVEEPDMDERMPPILCLSPKAPSEPERFVVSLWRPADSRRLSATETCDGLWGKCRLFASPT